MRTGAQVKWCLFGVFASAAAHEQSFPDSYPTRRSSDLSAPDVTTLVRVKPSNIRILPSPSRALDREFLHLDRLHRDRKSTRLNSSHVKSSYAVFRLQKRTLSMLCASCASAPPATTLTCT